MDDERNTWRHRAARWGDLGVVRDVAETFAARTVLTVVQACVGIVVARVLGPSGMGDLSLAMTAASLAVQFGTLGLHAANSYVAAARPEAVPRLTANSLAHATAIGGLGAAVIVAVSQGTPWLPLPLTLALLAAAMTPLQLAELTLQPLLIVLGQVRLNNAISTVSGLVGQAMIVALLAAGFAGAAGLMGVALLSAAAAVAARLVALFRRGAGGLRTDWPLLTTCIPYGLRNFTGSLFGYLLLRFDIVMLGALRGSAETGVYSVAVRIVDLLMLLSLSTSSVLFPHLSRIDDLRVRWQTMLRFTLLAASGLSGLSIAAALAAPLLLPALLGPDFADAVTVLYWLLPGAVALSANAVFQNFFGSVGQPWISVTPPLVGCVLNLALNALWIPQRGAVGAAQASLAAYCCTTACCGICLWAMRDKWLAAGSTDARQG